MGGIVPRKQSLTLGLQPGAKKTSESENAQTKVKKPPSIDRSATKKRKKFGIIRRPASLKGKIFYLLIPAFITGLYIFDINNFPPLSPGNAGESLETSSDIDSIAYLPVKVVLVVLHKLGIGNQYNMRYLSVLVMLFGIFCFYKFISSLVRKRMAVFATLLFSCSTWALLQARQDSITTMQLALIPAVLYLGGLIITSNSLVLRFISSVLLAEFIFVPGAIWFFLFIFVIAIYLNEKVRFRSIILPFTVFVATLAAYAAILFHWSLTGYHQLIKLLGPELGSLPSISTIKANALDLPGQLFYSGLNDPSWLSQTPIIDWVTLSFLIAGVIYLIKTKQRPIKKKIIVSFFVLALALIILNGIAYVSILLPIAYLVVGLGITYLADQWMIIFPNNPLARSLGLIMIGLVIFTVCFFHLERYFVGWPKTSEYHQIYKS